MTGNAIRQNVPARSQPQGHVVRPDNRANVAAGAGCGESLPTDEQQASLTRDGARMIETRLRPFVARRVPASDVDDVLQDIFVRMQRGLPSLRDQQRLSSWLFQVARSAIAERGRDRGRHAVVDGDGGAELPAPVDDDDREAAQSLAGCVSPLVAQLPSPYREAVTLVELEGLTVRDAAQMVGMTVSGMKSRVSRGRAQLRRIFEQCCDIVLDARGKVTDYAPRRQSCGPCSQPRGPRG